MTPSTEDRSTKQSRRFPKWLVELVRRSDDYFLSHDLLALPFMLRQMNSIQHFGQLICGVLASTYTISVWTSSGQAIGVLPFLPILPVLGLLVGGGRSAFRSSLASRAIAGMGLGMVMTDQAPIPNYAGPSSFDRDARNALRNRAKR